MVLGGNVFLAGDRRNARHGFSPSLTIAVPAKAATHFSAPVAVAESTRRRGCDFLDAGYSP
jgi:hypothetical protein